MTQSSPAGAYIPPAYVAPDAAELVRRYAFATLVTVSDAGFHATATPLFFETDGDATVLIGHMALANPQAQALTAGQPALAIFQGPHAYVSASWYVERPSVPTWNYVSAQAEGVLEPIDDEAGRIEVLRHTAAALEGEVAAWTLEDAPPGRMEALLPRIRAFRLRVRRLDGITKLSQTNPAGDRLHVIRHLLALGDGGSLEVARLMADLETGFAASP